MIKQSDKFLEVQQDWDLKVIELRKKYEQDLAVFQKCIDAIEKTRQQRTYEFEQEYLKGLREYEEKSSRFDMRNEEQSLARTEAENAS
ncbi:MAG TPA: hypothetical protein PKM71_08785 [Candidatus Cloacimonas sp.]|nr:hypothetical protein [Candidatus Cloacimonas sp.]